VLLLLTSMIALGLIGGYLAGGSLAGLKDIELRGIAILFGALAVAFLPLIFDSLLPHRRVFQLITFAGVLLFLAVNLWTSRGEIRFGMLVITSGWALNFIVIATNGGMPLSRWAYRSSGQTTRITLGSGGFYRIVRLGPTTHLARLGDVIPIRAFQVVVSIGDIFLLLGASIVIAAAMRAKRRGHDEAQARVEQTTHH